MLCLHPCGQLAFCGGRGIQSLWHTAALSPVLLIGHVMACLSA